MKDQFQTLLDRFHKAIESNPEPTKIKKILEAIKEDAANSGELNIRQKDAIIARCENYLNGTYGNTKTEAHLGHQKSPEKK